MRRKYFNNLIAFILIVSFTISPYFFAPSKANAQGASGFASGLAPAIALLPQCKSVSSRTKALFVGVVVLGNSMLADNSTEESLLYAGLASGATYLASEYGDEAVDWVKKKLKLGDKVQQAGNGVDSINVNISGTEEGKAVLDSQKRLTELENQAKLSTDNSICIQSVGRLMTKMLLQKLTLSTVNWINSGFDGQPAYIQDPGKFFEDIAKNEILQFGLEINNPELFPFGKAWLQNQAQSFNNKFADNARYSLDEMIRNTTPEFSAISFQQDFSQGGWGAWSAMTQYPQNNPLGFQLMASEELQRRLEGTSQSVAQNVRDALQEADGFLGDQRCIEAATGEVNLNITRSQHEAELRKTPPKILCSSWEYVTPGKLIADAAISTREWPEKSLLEADDLNDAIAAIMDALLNRFSTDLMAKGYAYFNEGDEGSDGTLVLNPDLVRVDYTTQTGKDFTPVHLTSSWLSSNPNFNIRTDLTQALIDEQRTYSDKLTLQNKELNSTTDGKDYKIVNGISNAYGLIPAISQLDYCIPGPHPGWEEDSRRVLDARTNVITPETVESVQNLSKDALLATAKAVATAGGVAGGAAIGASLGSVFPVVGTIVGGIVGAGVGLAIGWLAGDDNPKKVRNYYANIIEDWTGVRIDYARDSYDTGADSSDYRGSSLVVGVNNLMSKQGAVQVLNITLERYIDIAHKVYNSKILPSVHREAASEFRKLKGYAQMIENNEDEIADMKNVITTLIEIKSKVDSLNATYPDGGETYENELKPHINAFGRVSSSMVNGNDIASVDDLLKQIMEERNYIYKDLLKGPLGCEKDLQEGKQNMPAQLYQTKRMEYPFPILYTYDMGAGAEIPDPFPEISGLDPNTPNKTNSLATHAYGPGFLSFYSFQVSRDSQNRAPGDPRMLRHLACADAIADENGAVPWCELKLEDILPLHKGIRARRLGLIPNTIPTDTCIDRGINAPISCSTSPWEQTIGVY